MSLEGMDDHEQLILSDSSVIVNCGDLECFQHTLYEMLAPAHPSSSLSLPGDGINQILNQIQQLSLAQHSNFHSSSIKLPQYENSNI